MLFSAPNIGENLAYEMNVLKVSIVLIFKVSGNAGNTLNGREELNIVGGSSPWFTSTLPSAVGYQ